jgi:hypothetical protein
MLMCDWWIAKTGRCTVICSNFLGKALSVPEAAMGGKDVGPIFNTKASIFMYKMPVLDMELGRWRCG